MSNMKNQFIEDTFKDFKGNTRSFIVAAVPEDYLSMSLNVSELKELVNTDCPECQENIVDKSDSMLHLVRVVFGVSFCNPEDENIKSPELGRTIAIGKAKSIKRRIGEMYFSSKMFVDYTYIQKMLNKYADSIKAHPEYFNKPYQVKLKKFQDWCATHPVAKPEYAK